MGVRYLKIGPNSQEVIHRVIEEHVRRGGRVFDLMVGVEEPAGLDPEVSPAGSRPRRWLVWAALATAAAVALLLLLAGGLLPL